MGERMEKRFVRVPERDRVLFQFIVESYEGVATVTTVDAAEGVVSLTFSPAVRDDVLSVLFSLSREMEIRLFSEGETDE